MKIVCVFAIHRTGTNYLVSALAQRPEIATFAEVFHAQQAFGLKPAHVRALGEEAGATFAAADDPRLLAWLQAHPVEAIETLARLARRKGREAMFLKVFLGHWRDPAAVIARLAREPGFVPIVLRRRNLDVYVSYRKAEAVGRYRHVDTTDVRVTLDAAAYARWAEAARAWYALVRRALADAGRTPELPLYETDVDLPADALVRRWWPLMGLGDFEGDGTSLDPARVLVRQDRTPDVADRVANFEAFAAGLRERGLWEESQGWFEAA